MTASLDTMRNKAIALFKKFRRRAPRDTKEIFLVDAQELVALEIGPLVGVLYKREGKKHPYLHRFNRFNRPVLASSFDGSQLYILAGGYRLTDRGIEG
jgi:hypothetical protein